MSDHVEISQERLFVPRARLSQVIIPKKAVGEFVNLEVDCISKYVEQSLAAVVARVEALEAKLAAAER